ncbi:hypothetical protein BC629DRAFT_45077 [Irpex lacteus]|nr:hypothetical protein BC629DRAFT_45077 [Irpex lacteus]
MKTLILYTLLVSPLLTLTLALPSPPSHPSISPQNPDLQPRTNAISKSYVLPRRGTSSFADTALKSKSKSNKKRIICEVDIPGEYPEAETKALGMRRDLGNGGSPCVDSEDDGDDE